MRYYIRLCVGYLIARILHLHIMYYTDGLTYIVKQTKIIDDMVYGSEIHRVPLWLAKCYGLYMNYWCFPKMDYDEC